MAKEGGVPRGGVLGLRMVFVPLTLCHFDHGSLRGRWEVNVWLCTHWRNKDSS